MMPNWHAVPFIRICLPFLGGIVLAFVFQEWLTCLPFISLFGCCFLFLIYKKRIPYKWRWIYGLFASIMFFALGYQLTVLKDETFFNSHFSKKAHHDLTLTGKVTAIVKNPFGIQYRVKVKTRIKDGTAYGSSGNLMVFFEEDPAQIRPEFGELILFSGSVYRFSPPKNPNQFDYQRYMHFQNIHFQMKVRGGKCRILEDRPTFDILKIADQFRIRFLSILENKIKGAHERGVASALLLGWKSDLDDTILNAYRNTGSAHVLAVSGLHVGLVFLILSFFMQRFRRGRIWRKLARMIVLLVGVWMFALVTGASPSVQRAATMLSFVIVGQTLNRQNNIYNTLAISAFFLLCLNPYLLVQPGFQLSYIAVIGIVFFQPRIYKMIYFRNKAADKIWALMAVSLAAQFVTFPLSVYYFHQFPFFFWLTGIIVVPAAAVIMPLGVGLFAFGWIKPVGAGLGFVLNFILKTLNTLILGIEQIPDAYIEGLWISPVSVVVLYVFILGMISALITRSPGFWFVPLVCMTIISAIYAYTGVEEITRKQICIYYMRNTAQVDFIKGKTAYSLRLHSGKEQEEDEIKRYVPQNHSALNIKEVKISGIRSRYSGSGLYLQNGFVQFYDKKLAFIDNSNFPGRNVPLKVDELLIFDAPKDLHAVLQDFDPENVIIHSSVPAWKVKRIKEVLDRSGAKYTDMRQKKAVIINM